MTQVNPYLNFNGQCREALSFYQQCLEAELQLQKVSESPMAAKMPSEKGPLILHGSVSKAGTTLLMGSDMIGDNLRPGNSVNLCLQCNSDQDVHKFFDRLAAGGQVKVPLHQSFWGATFGEIKDKFGVTWMLNYTRN